MKNVITLSNVSKHYGKKHEASRKFWDLLFGREPVMDGHWALHNISLKIERGAAVGLVGRNGAGKSTLLQLIAGTAQPTVGQVQVDGKVAPLLELGAGFNLDYTGKENVKVASTLVGIDEQRRAELLEKIEEFADIGEFIDRPVRTYSSGMFARLAFAVAVHVEPDILLIDEILSVGDMGFQQKCISRLRQLREQGVTLIFVSHGVDAIKSVCDRAIFFHGGEIVYDGPADETVDRYLSFIREEMNQEQLSAELNWPKIKGRSYNIPGSLRYGSGHAQFVAVDVQAHDGESRRSFSFGDSITIVVTIKAMQNVSDLSFSFLVRDGTGVDLFGTTTFDDNMSIPQLEAGSAQRLSFTFKNNLKPGNYGVSVAVNRVSRKDYTDNILLDQIDGAVAFTVLADPNRPIHYKIWQDIDIRVETFLGAQT